MCGIAGYVQRARDVAADAEIIARMTARLRHRGPDGDGVWQTRARGQGEWDVALGHRRLSIIDLEGGRQPLGNEDGRVQITFNGEIYNFAALRGALESHGHTFATRSDTEAIVHHYEQHGIGGIRALSGMFAFAIWDGRDGGGSLVLARDRVGIKPLYYATLPDGGIAFGSELTALLEHPDVPREFSPDGLRSYFFADYAQAPLTVLAGVRKLAPGHVLVWRDGRIVREEAFWSLAEIEPRSDVGGRSEDELADELWDRLREAVKAQLIADVPVGIFLSGGIDSSTIATLAAEVTQKPLHTFSIGFEDAQYDESRYAKLMSERLGTRHDADTLRAADLLTHLDDALSCLDEPMADPSIVPTYLLSRVAARHVKVVLGGDGGDELWAGYAPHKAHYYARFYAALPGFIRRGAIEPSVARLRVKDGYQTFEWKAKRFALRWDDDALVRHLRWMSCVDLPDLADALRGGGGNGCGEDLPAPWDALASPAFDDPINAVLALDFQTYLPGSILSKVDRASMAHGLEVRPPLLHNELIDWTFALPGHLKLRRSRTKYLLKRAAGRHLPRTIVRRRKKGFGIPLAEWIRGPLAERIDRILRDSPLWDSPLLGRETFARWRSEHNASRVDHAKPLWALLVLDHWVRCNAASLHRAGAGVAAGDIQHV